MAKIEKKKEFQKLIAAGKQKGYLTYEEINDALPDNVTDSDAIDEVMNLLESNDIEIVENEKEHKAKQEEGGEEGEGKRARGDRGASSDSSDGDAPPAKGGEEEETMSRGLDPVRLYLKKMGSVALLTREGEI